MIPKKTSCLLSALFLLAFLVTSSSAVTYEYDDLNRLVKAAYEDGTVTEYTYDEVGNRLNMETTVTDPDEGEPQDNAVSPPSPPQGIKTF
jgi:YD repeat-containing protein